jgi:hypothetical protein
MEKRFFLYTILAILMVKPMMLLASRAVEVNRSVVVHLTRLQYGFLPERNLAQTQEILNTLQDLVRQMEYCLAHPPPPSRPPAVPLK